MLNCVIFWVDIVFICLCIIMIIRNEIIYIYNKRAMSEGRMDFVTYDRMLWDLKKWKYRHFFPK